MKVVGKIYDEHHALGKVTIWHAAAREIFQTDAETFHGLWESCADPAAQESMLKEMNKHVEVVFTFFCTAKIWRYGSNNEKVTVQINIDRADRVLEDK